MYTYMCKHQEIDYYQIISTSLFVYYNANTFQCHLWPKILDTLISIYHNILELIFNILVASFPRSNSRNSWRLLILLKKPLLLINWLLIMGLFFLKQQVSLKNGMGLTCAGSLCTFSWKYRRNIGEIYSLLISQLSVLLSIFHIVYRLT